MVLSLEGGGAFEVKNIGCVFDDAQEGRVAVFVPTDFAKSILGKSHTRGRAESDSGLPEERVRDLSMHLEGRKGGEERGVRLSGDRSQVVYGGRRRGEGRREGNRPSTIDDPCIEVFQGGLDGGIVQESFFSGGGGGGGSRF